MIDRKDGLKLQERIKGLKREQEIHGAEIKLYRMIMDLNEKRGGLITAITARKLQYLTSQLDGVPPPERDHEVEKNEIDMYHELTAEILDLEYSLTDCLTDCFKECREHNRSTV